MVTKQIMTDILTNYCKLKISLNGAFYSKRIIKKKNHSIKKKLAVAL